MGMDLEGKLGGSFSSNIHIWHPLWEFCCKISPWIDKRVPNAHYNDGGGLTGPESLQLAKELRIAMAKGLHWANDGVFSDTHPDPFLKVLQSMPGIRVKMGRATGLQPESVEEFVDFLDNCGGFEIW